MTPTNRSLRLFTALALLGSAGLTTGCAEGVTGAAAAGGAYLYLNRDELPLEDWSEIPARKEPKVDLAQFSHDVHFSSGSTRLIETESARLEIFLDKADLPEGTAIYLVTGKGAGAERRRATVEAYLRHLKLNPVIPPDNFGIDAPQGDSVRVFARRHVVTLPPCPDWTERPGRIWNNTVHRNWGCATAANLGLMVADPAHLARGERMGALDGEYAAGAVERYRKGETKALAPEDVSKLEEQQKTNDSSSGGASLGGLLGGD